MTSSTISSGELPDTLPCVWFSQMSFSKENGVQMLQNKPNLLEKTTNLIIWKLASFLQPIPPKKPISLKCLLVQRLEKAIHERNPYLLTLVHRIAIYLKDSVSDPVL